MNENRPAAAGSGLASGGQVSRIGGTAYLSRALLFIGLGLLIVGTAVFAAVFFHDRTALTTMSARWAVIWTITAGVLTSWLWWDVRKSSHAHLTSVAWRWLPLTIPTGLALLVYGSDSIHHAVTSWNRIRILYGALALAALALIWLAQRAAWRQAASRAEAWSATLTEAAPVVIVVSLFVQGLIQATPFLHLAVDDLVRYWTIADALATGGGYRIWEAGVGTAQGGGSGYWTDLPVLPMLLMVSFTLFGHTFTAAHVPMLLANIALPFVLYALYLRLTSHRLWAFIGTSLILFLPFFQIYTLGASEPDPVFIVLLAALDWRVVALARCDAAIPPDKLRWHGLAVGLLAAATALIRPEGIVYAALVPAGLLFHRRSRRSLWWALGPATVLVGGFAAAMWPAVQRPWPQAPRELDPANILANVESAHEPLAHAAQHLYLAEPVLLALLVAGVSLAVFGAISLIRIHPALVGLPVALLAHGTLLLLLDPFSLRTADPTESIRHISYAWPLLLGLVLPLFPRLRRIPHALTIAVAVVLVSAFAYLTATAEEVCAFGYFTTVAEDGCANQGRGSLLRSEIYLLWTDLLHVQYSLPARLDDASFLTFRGDLFAAYRPYDMHGTDSGFDYQLAGWLAFAAALPFIVARERYRVPPLARSRRHADLSGADAPAPARKPDQRRSPGG